MEFFLLSFALLPFAAALPSGELQSRQSMVGMPGMSPDVGSNSFPWPIDKDLVEGGNIIKIRYGPFEVPAVSETRPQVSNMKKPCQSCWITALQGGLEYENGTVANADTGAWLHHMQMNRKAEGKEDLTCGDSLLGMFMGERIYAVGNEREVSRMNNKAKYGILLQDDDKLASLPELMNESPEPITVYITMLYETIPTASPESQGYKETRMMWLDITGCGISSVKAKEGAYELKQSPGWTSDIDGRLMYGTGHVHNGGTKTTIYRKRGDEVKIVCESHMRYGGTPQSKSLDGMENISAASYCDFPEDDSVRVGDVFYVGASYNSTAHMLMAAPGEGKLEPLMGISRVYIGI